MVARKRERLRSLHTAILAEALEARTLLSALSTTLIPPAPFRGAATQSTGISHPIAISDLLNPNGSSSPPGGALTPSEMRGAYGVDQIFFGSIQGDGTGQTIAIIDAYDDPTAYSDLTIFDSAFGIPNLNLYSTTQPNTAPYFRQVAQDGSTNLPGTDPAGPGNNTWEEEESLDVQWAHAIAPGANIILVEATNSSNSNLITGAVGWARTQPGISVISMSFGGDETSSEIGFDSTFTTPSGHAGITFVASTGDDASPGEYPAFSPNVVAVGGTSLSISTTGTTSTYAGETGWSGSGGGISTLESLPAYQAGVVTQSTNHRTIPDVSMDADPNTGVAVYDSYDFGSNGWFQVGGTSLAAPMFTAVIAITDQGRALDGLSSLDGSTQTLPMLYQLPNTDFHDITAGSNGFSAAPGYDLVTGRGSPVANLFVPDLVGVATVTGTVYSDNNDDASLDAGDTPLSGATVFVDANDNAVLDSGSVTQTIASTLGAIAIPDKNSTGITSNIDVTSLGTISDLNITFNITHTFDSDLIGFLSSPSGTTITLFSHVGSNGHNFTNTTLDDQATTSITLGKAPFSGTFSPSPGALSAFNGQSAYGIWTFRVADTVTKDTGTLNSWSLTLTTTNNEPSATTDANGNYSFLLPVNTSFNIGEIPPATYIASTPTSAAVTVHSGTTTGPSFGNIPTVFNASGANDSFFVTLDPNTNKTAIYASSTATGTPTYELSTLSALTFNLAGQNSILTVDFSNGSPLTAGGTTINGVATSNQNLTIVGQNTSQAFTVTDTQILPASGPAITFNNIPTLTVAEGNFTTTADLNTLQNLNLNAGSTFNWNN